MRFVLSMLLCSLLTLSLTGRMASAADATKPNILLILTDDQGWPTLGCYGGKLVPTPNLDRLAAEGVRFTDAYVTPQCTPTRASLLTGQYTSRNGMWHVIGWYGYPWAPVAEPLFVESLPRDTFTLAKGLKAAGYTTGIFGKWHLTTTADGDYVRLRPEASAAYGFDKTVAPPPNNRSHATGDKDVDRLTDEAIAFMRSAGDKPFFCYLPHHTVHGPLAAPDALVKKYRDAGAPETGLHNATYLAMLEHLDASVGRLLTALDESKLADNTIVIFMSDNGGVHELYDPAPHQTGSGSPEQLIVKEKQYDNAPLRAGKGSAYEGGIRVPMIVRWPGKAAAGRVSNVPVHIVDLMPTLFAAADAAAPPADHKLDGVSLLPLLSGKGEIPDRALYWYMPLYDLRWGATPCAVIRDGDHKLIEYFGDWFDPSGKYVPGHRLELFNLRDDVSEKQNLAAEKPELAAKLQAKLHAHLKEAGATVPAANPAHEPSKALQETKVKPPHLADGKAVKAADTVKATPPLPSIKGDWRRIAAPPELEQFHKPGLQPVDFTIYQAADGTWQLISCVRGTTHPGGGRLLYRWESKNLTDADWKPMGIFQTADPKLGQAEGKIQAPHCVKEGGKYYLFYNSNGAYCMISDDGKTFRHHKNSDGELKFFDMPRDVMIFDNRPRDGLWYAFFTDIVPGKYIERKTHTISVRTAKALEGPWSKKKTDIGVVSPTPKDAYTFVFAESPFVIFRDGWYYRLEQLNVLASKELLDEKAPIFTTLGGDDPRRYLAPELIEHNGKWYIAGYAYRKGVAGIYLAEMEWAR